MKILGLDIGGANLKGVLLEVSKGIVIGRVAATQYFPIWMEGKDRLSFKLRVLIDSLTKGVKLDRVGLTMTAELSDVFESKREGVNYILDCVGELFRDVWIGVVDVKAELRSIEDARRNHLLVSGANWAATAWMTGRIIDTCILMDVGSTTTDIIPIVKGGLTVKGMNDLERLAYGELVYTGALRTNVAVIVSSIPVRGRMTRVSSELFALSGDVHLILRNIQEGDYTTETADGRGRSRGEALARLARVVCGDMEVLSEEEVEGIASYIYEKQIEAVREGLLQVSRSVEEFQDSYPTVVTAGLGGFIAEAAAFSTGFTKLVRLDDVLGVELSKAAPAYASALRAACELSEEV